MLRKYLLMGIFISCLVFGCIACSLSGSNSDANGNNKAAQAPAKTVLPTPTPGATLSATSVQSIPSAMAYYQAIKQKDYAKAFLFVDPHATTTSGNALTESVLAQMARSEDTNYGPISTVEMIPGSSDGTQLVLTIDRGSGMHYHTHLTLKKEGNGWKVVSIDRV